MKINIAVYTAQEGYSWQPGTALTMADLKQYKECMGKFPSPESSEFPFGGIFLKNDKVVFYRYHVAKKIDFVGRDALYCVLGVLPKNDAASINPVQLFELPQFAAPMQPFPVEAMIEESDLDAVPVWLKNLDDKTLDVRIPGNSKSIDDWEVELKDIPKPVVAKPEPVKPESDIQISPVAPVVAKPIIEKEPAIFHELNAKSQTATTPVDTSPNRGSTFNMKLLVLLLMAIIAVLAMICCFLILERERSKFTRTVVNTTTNTATNSATNTVDNTVTNTVVNHVDEKKDVSTNVQHDNAAGEIKK